MCSILIEAGIVMNLVRLMNMCLNEAYNIVRVGKHLYDIFPIKSDLKQGDALSPLFFNFASWCAITGIQVSQDGLKLNCAHWLLFYANYCNVFGGRVHNVKQNTEALMLI